MSIAVGAAFPDSIMAEADDDEAHDDILDEDDDTFIGHSPPASDDNLPLASLASHVPV